MERGESADVREGRGWRRRWKVKGKKKRRKRGDKK
jgi:hypothetical protein